MEIISPLGNGTMAEPQHEPKLPHVPRVISEDDPHYHDEEPDIVQDDKHPPRGQTRDPRNKRRLPPPRRRYEE
jgi:hypothetical protein